MASLNRPLLSIMFLAIATTLSGGARADDVAVTVAQTYFPAPGAVDIERNNSFFTSQVKANYANALGLSGKGVTIAILDTGIAAHNEFAETGRILKGYNAATGSTDVTDRAGHGTHVAGLIGADRDGRGMLGVAYDAWLLPIKVFDDSGVGMTTYVDRGLRYAIGKASIVNMSLGAASAINPMAMKEAVAAGMLIVAAAGNSAAADPGWPARFAKEAWANNQILAVGAVDAKNQLAPFSNRAGDTAAWYLVAPGVNLASTYLGQNYALMSGTSMAAPIVSGAAALIKQMWPYLRADQIGTILLITATDLGAPGIDPVYGRGLLNIEKALQPVGAVKTITWSGASIKVLQTSLAPSAATSKLWTLAAAGALDALGTDDFNRSFSLKMGASIARPPSMSLEQVFGDLGRRNQIAERVLDDGARFTAVSLSQRGDARRQPVLSSFAYASAPGRGTEFAFGTGGLGSSYFGIAGSPALQALGATPALVNPYFSLLPGATHMALGAQVDRASTLRFGLLRSGVGQAIDERDPLTDARRETAGRARADMALVEWLRNFDAGALSLSFSRTVEQNAFLAMQSQGSLAFGPGASTTAVQFGGAWLLAPRLALAGQAAWGVTPGSADPLSLISRVAPLRTNTFSLALMTAGVLRPGDRFSLSVAQPMRTYDGAITLDSVTAIDDAGRQLREQRQLSLVPTARETITELNYHAPSVAGGSLNVVLSLRRHPNHLDDAPTEKLLALRLARAF